MKLDLWTVEGCRSTQEAKLALGGLNNAIVVDEDKILILRDLDLVMNLLGISF